MLQTVGVPSNHRGYGGHKWVKSSVKIPATLRGHGGRLWNKERVILSGTRAPGGALGRGR